MDRCDIVYSSAAEILLNSGAELQNDYNNPNEEEFRRNFRSHR